MSNRQGLEWILANDSSATITVSADHPVVAYNILILSAEQRARLVVVPPGEGTYFLAFYRCWPYPSYEGRGWEVHAEYSNGVKILSVMKR
ncbi:hypothetical protein [Hymenobacter koreensis]|uniref:Uncharacterized protein n=1 Tax=Hymenobacter koreensis TaxID=1084523 RepID=A0ABP8JFM7_9BACT